MFQIVPNYSKLFQIIPNRSCLQAQAAQQAEQFPVTSIPTSVTSSPTASGVTSVPPHPPSNGLHPTHPHMPPHPHFPHPGQHPHFPHPLGLEPPRPRFFFKMPRVVPNQKEKFETDDLLKRHSREGEVRKKSIPMSNCKGEVRKF